MVSLHTTTRAPLGSLRNGRHNPCDHKPQRKYGKIYAIVFIRIIACTILQVHISYVHTFHLNTSSGQGRHPLMISQRSPGTGVTPVFGALPPLRFTDQQQTGRLRKEGIHDGATTPL